MNYISRLNEDCVREILQYLNITEILYFGITSKRFEAIVFEYLSTTSKYKNGGVEMRESNDLRTIQSVMMAFASRFDSWVVKAEDDMLKDENFHNIIELWEKKFRQLAEDEKQLLNIGCYLQYVIGYCKSFSYDFKIFDDNNQYDGYFGAETDPEEIRQRCLSCYGTIAGHFVKVINTCKMEKGMVFRFNLSICVDMRCFYSLIGYKWHEIVKRMDKTNMYLFTSLKDANMEFHYEVHCSSGHIKFELMFYK